MQALTAITTDSQFTAPPCSWPVAHFHVVGRV
jgi:hypothetical protein